MISTLRWAVMTAILCFILIHNEGQHKTVSTNHNFWRERRAKSRESNRHHLHTSLTLYWFSDWPNQLTNQIFSKTDSIYNIHRWTDSVYDTHQCMSVKRIGANEDEWPRNAEAGKKRLPHFGWSIKTCVVTCSRAQNRQGTVFSSGFSVMRTLTTVPTITPTTHTQANTHTHTHTHTHSHTPQPSQTGMPRAPRNGAVSFSRCSMSIVKAPLFCIQRWYADKINPRKIWFLHFSKHFLVSITHSHPTLLHQN